VDRPIGVARGEREPAPARPVVHLELHTPNAARACAFYARLLGWQAQTIRVAAGTYLTFETREGIEAGVVETEGQRGAFWLPYVEVADVTAASEEAARLGAAVLLPEREGPAGWRAIVATPAGGPVAFWQPKG
jgi:predicted enzyme related to lactoylglutathione lyase